MIPKVIHYCWFGGNPLSDIALSCINSWKKYCPDYEIIQWNEKNYNIENNLYAKEAYEEKNWAFVSDYARLDIIYRNGGIYLDTDVELIKSLDNLLGDSCFLALETSGYIATGLGFGAEKGSLAIKKMLDQYEGIHYKLAPNQYDTKPCPYRNTAPFISEGFKGDSKEIQILFDAKIYPIEYFCPLNNTDKSLNITKNTYSIHLYNASWISPEEKQMKSDVQKYRDSHSKFSTWLYKNYKECKLKYRKVNLIVLFKFILMKINKKLIKRKKNK